MPKSPALTIVLVLALLAPPVAVARANQQLADRCGVTFGQELAAVVARVVPRRAPATPPPPVFALNEADEQSLAAPPEKGKSRSGKSKRAQAKKRGVFVPAAAVLRLAEARAMPSAVPVPAQGTRPAGLRLVGVGGLGIGMRDGDVLTRVLGGGVASVADVVGRVIAARDRHVREISGEFWRDGEAWSVVVEQPYLTPAPSP